MPRAGLTPDIVGAEAARLADEVGLDRLTLAAIAERFGVAVPSLYKHVDGLEGVQRELAARAVHELGSALKTAIDSSDGDDLARLAAAYRAYARSHPGRYAATLRAPKPGDVEHIAASESTLSIVFGVLARYGLTGDAAVDAARALRSALHGFVSLETSGGFGMQQDVDRSFRRLVGALDAALRTWNEGTADARPRRSGGRRTKQ
jgi:AcrR family transcriptional regulator